MNPFNCSCSDTFANQVNENGTSSFSISTAVVTIFLQIVIMLKQLVSMYLQNAMNRKTDKNSKKIAKLNRTLSNKLVPSFLVPESGGASDNINKDVLPGNDDVCVTD